jgi:hypothetical protein
MAISIIEISVVGIKLSLAELREKFKSEIDKSGCWKDSQSYCFLDYYNFRDYIENIYPFLMMKRVNYGNIDAEFDHLIGLPINLFNPHNILENPKLIPSYLKKFKTLLDKKGITQEISVIECNCAYN